MDPRPRTESTGGLDAVLAHRGSMRLLDTIVDVAERSILAHATLSAPSALFTNRIESVWGIELVAQAVAAFAGHHAGKPIVGFLVSCREATFTCDELPANMRLTVEAQHVWGDQAMGLFRGRVLDGEAELVNVTIGVYSGPLPPNGKAFD